MVTTVLGPNRVQVHLFFRYPTRLLVSRSEPVVLGNHLRWRLHKLDKHTLAGFRGLVVALVSDSVLPAVVRSQQDISTTNLGVDESDLVARCTETNTAGSEAEALLGEVLDRGLDVVDPDTNVVQRGNVNLRNHQSPYDLDELEQILRKHAGIRPSAPCPGSEAA